MRKNRILLKVKFGNRCLKDVLPLIDDNGNELHSSSGKEPPKVSDAIDAEFTTAVDIDGLDGCSGNSMIASDVSVSNIRIAGNSIAESMTRTSLDDHMESPTQTDLEKLGTPVDKSCSGPGTSPDSEVIDAVSGAPISLKGIKDSPDLLVSDPACFSSRDAASVGAVQKGLKNKKKKDRAKVKDRMEKVSDSCAKGLLSSLETLNNEELVPKGSGDASALTTVNKSGNVDTNELQSEGTSPSPKLDDYGNSNAISDVELGERDNPSNRHNIVSRDSPMTEGSLSSLGKLKTPESTRYQGVGKSQPEICSSSPKRQHASKRKGIKEKKIGKCEEKQKIHGHIGVIEVKCNPTTNKPETNKLNLTDTVTNHVPPRNAWVQCDDCYKWRRISAPLADKIEETNCRWICKDNLDEHFADCSTPQEKSNSEINVELEISDMSGDEDVFDARPNRDLPGKKFIVCQSSTWTLIKSNLFLNRRRKSHTIDEIMICHCKTPSSGRVGCGNGCLNRMLNIECIPGSCPCGEQCSNQQFQRRSYANLKWYKCGRKGYGLQLLEDVREGSFIIEYVGEVLDMHAYEARQKEYALKGHKHFYFMALNSCEVIDACAKGNLGRFINHSCDPNCRTEKWIVNGEVCIGLFAVRDIKKGEELTFDYNYVRVVGAAAKKCVCGTPQCRGYIGGDPQNVEVIIQDDSDDEFPEPDVICEEDDMLDELENIKSASNLFRGSEERTDKEPREKKEAFVAVECLKATEENGALLNLSASSAAEKSAVLSGSGAPSCSSMQPMETTSPSDDITSETIFEAKQKCSEDEKDLKSLCSPEELEMASPSGTLNNKNKSSKSKSATVRRKVPPEKHSRSSPCVKKSTSIVVNTKTTAEIDMSSMMQDKSKKLVEGSSNGRFEAVEAKLNELLDLNGGISKSNDAPKYYLKLLLLTAASGDSGNGEAIQSNRELSMILGALLKTKSRTVLADIINKNGLQMLHNIIKRFRREFSKTPILRKLLKVLEYLALREILTIDHINWVPSRPGVESFRESILALTDHIDKQVHQIARNFRDRWIPKPLHRKNSRMDNNNRLESTTRDPSEAAPAAACNTPHLVPIGAKTRKRKSRWDEGPVREKNGHDPLPESEFPPGFSPPVEHCTAKQPVMGHCQHRFVSRIMVSYGIPFNLVQKIGVPVNESFGSWVVAPGVPFNPFPPLPPYARGRS